MDDHIYKAAINGNIDVLTENEDKVRDQETHDKNTVLHLASQFGKTECVQRILKMHPVLLWKLNSASETGLHLAAKQGHAPVVRALIEEANTTQCTPDLEQSAKSGGSISLKETMIRMVNKEKDTALHEAARYNRVDVVRLLVNEDKKDSHTTNKEDETPLYVAAYRGYNDVVQVICGTCTSPAYGGSDGRTVLHAAVISHNPAMLAYLLGWKKLLIKETDKHGWTALHYAAHFNYTEEAKSLILAEKLVAYIADKCENRSTALHIAANIGNINVMKEIIAVCPDCFTMVDNNSQNVLHIAAKLGNKDMIAYIYRNCVVISSMLGQKDKDGNTPLHLLAQSGCYFPEILQHEMADKEALNNEKMTPLDVIFCVDQVLAEQVNVQNTLIENHANSTWNLWRAIKGDKVFKRKKVDGEKKIDSLKKMGETHMIVAALIAAISFTAGFTLPGGFNGNEGPNLGMAILTRKSAFKAFIITNTISLVFSSSSLVMYFLAAIYKNAQDVWKLLIAAIVFNLLAIVAMVLAFITGTYVVLPHPSLIAVAVCVIGCSFFVIQSFTLRKCYRTRKRIVQFVENVNMS